MTAGFDLDEIERLLAAATSGEWESIAEVGVENFANSIYAPAGEWDGLLLARADQNGSTDNAALIVALHNSAPAMIAAIRELRAENARLKGAIQHRGGPLCPARYSGAAACDCGVSAALGEPQ